MSLAVALILAAAPAAAPPPPASGVQLVSAQVHAVILEAVVVRQASGLELARNVPTPQITRRDGTVLVEFQ